MTRASLKSYFASNKAYIGLCKSTHFRWAEEKKVPREILDNEGKGTGKYAVENVMEKKSNNTSAYMFNYDILKDLMNVDFERIEEETEVKDGEFVPNKEGGDLPF